MKLTGGARFIVAWAPRGDRPGVCIAAHGGLKHPFPYDCDTIALEATIGAHALLEIAADMLMNGAAFALLDAAFLVFPAWRRLQIRGGYVAHSPDGAWNPHYPDWPEDLLEAYAQDAAMFGKRRRHDVDAGFPAAEVWSADMRRVE